MNLINLDINRDVLKYLGACMLGAGLILGAYIVGAREGIKSATAHFEAEKNELKIESEQQNRDLIDSQIRLTQCEAKRAGDCALDCESITQERVSQALASCAEICKD